jgi:large subunit ribosomal protein L30e
MEETINSAEIKKMVKAGNFVVGTERTVKGLRTGKVQKVLVSSNCPAKVEKSINYYAGMSGATVHKLEYPNDELGIICKRPFSISVLAFLKGAK